MKPAATKASNSIPNRSGRSAARLSFYRDCLVAEGFKDANDAIEKDGE